MCLLNRSLLLSSFHLVSFAWLWRLRWWTEIHIDEEISDSLEIMEEISSKVLWYVSKDVMNAVSVIQVMIFCETNDRSTADRLTTDCSMTDRLKTDLLTTDRLIPGNWHGYVPDVNMCSVAVIVKSLKLDNWKVKETGNVTKLQVLPNS